MAADGAGAVEVGDDGIEIRLLDADEGAMVGDAIRVAYGDSYDAAWVYDADEVGRRIADGRFVSCVALDPDGALLCHAGVSRSSVDEHVGESGQAVTLPAARGHHLFQRVKQHLAHWSTGAGLYGLFSEVTTAHPYSERANVDLGAVETGFLLGWIPSTVSNDAASGRSGRTSVALFYLKTNDGHDRPVYAPPRHRDAVAGVIAVAGLRGSLADAPGATVPPTGPSDLHAEVRADHNIAIVTVLAPGADLVERVLDERRRHFDAGIDVLYVDLALEDPRTEHVGERLDDAGVSFAGVFPNRHVAGDVLRLQALNGLDIGPDDVTTASDHGRHLLDYVLADAAGVAGGG